MAKRGHREGSIYQRESDGKWVGSVHLGYTNNGKRKRRMVYGNTRREVSEKLKIILRDQAMGLPVAAVRQTLGEFLDQWLVDVVKPTVRPRTYESYAQIVRNHLKPALGRVQLQKLGAQEIQKYMNEKRASGLSARTVQYQHSVLRSALQRAMKWDLVPRNVAKLADPPKARRTEIKPWNVEQARSFLQAVKGYRLEALYSVALALGLRRGEALGLHWDDVDLDKHTLTVRQALQRVGSKLELAETKTERSHRTIALPKVTVAALRVHKVRQLEERLQMGSSWRDCGLVFTSTIGTPLEPRNVSRDFGILIEELKLPKVRFHDLRHTCATLLLAQGVPARVVMETLGHSQIALTMNTYSHVLPELQREAANRMDELLSAEK